MCVFFRSPFFYSPFAFHIPFLRLRLSTTVDGCLPDARPDQHDTCCCIIRNDARRDLRGAAADGAPPLRDICAAPGDNNWPGEYLTQKDYRDYRSGGEEGRRVTTNKVHRAGLHMADDSVVRPGRVCV